MGELPSEPGNIMMQGTYPRSTNEARIVPHQVDRGRQRMKHQQVKRTLTKSLVRDAPSVAHLRVPGRGHFAHDDVTS